MSKPRNSGLYRKWKRLLWFLRQTWRLRSARNRAEVKRLISAFGPPGDATPGAQPFGPTPTEWAGVLSANPRLNHKVLHDCHLQGLSVAQRVDRVIEHHALARQLFGTAMFRQAHIDSAGFLLCELALPGGHGMLPVRLNRHLRYLAEGELTLALHDPFGSLIYTLTFSLQGAPAQPGLLIGSLIGVTTIDNIRHLTRLMQGLRPQALLLALAQALCRALALAPLRAVSQRGHIFADTDRADRVRFDYDGFWAEHGGTRVPGDDRLFELPTADVPRAEADIPSRKRALYRRRHAMLQQVEQNMRARLAAAGAAVTGADSSGAPAKRIAAKRTD